jgi:hypothetical protein
MDPSDWEVFGLAEVYWDRVWLEAGKGNLGVDWQCPRMAAKSRFEKRSVHWDSEGRFVRF